MQINFEARVYGNDRGTISRCLIWIFIHAKILIIWRMWVLKAHVYAKIGNEFNNYIFQLIQFHFSLWVRFVTELFITIQIERNFLGIYRTFSFEWWKNFFIFIVSCWWKLFEMLLLRNQVSHSLIHIFWGEIRVWTAHLFEPNEPIVVG